MLALHPAGATTNAWFMVDSGNMFERERRALGRAMRRIRERKGLTQAETAKRIAVADQQWQRWEAGDRNPRKDRYGDIASALDVSVEELLNERTRLATSAEEAAPVAPSADLIGVYGYAAGAGERITVTSGSELRWVPKHPAQYGYRKVGAAEIIGESMYPRWKPRELAYFVFDLMPPRGEDVIVELRSGEAMIKEYVGRRPGEDGGPGVLRLKEFYPEERILEISEADVRALHAVVG